ncbi:DedA family protein [Nocardia sp. NPDC057440]|uniref:DedA family protein n=1 Tax=Nocardia sp. NPDC057440 TaxID=3346134 RepID=UPI0036717B29
MNDQLLDLARDVMGSPLVYLVVFALAALDGVLPVFPSEVVLLVSGGFAATGRPNIGLLILAASAGAAVGDQVSYRIGRHAGRPMLRKIPLGTKRHRAVGWIASVLERRGPVFIVIGRFLPGMRSIMTLTAGAVGVAPRVFTAFDIIGAVLWGMSGALLGYFGGNTFQDSPLAGFCFALVLVTTVVALGEAGRRLQASGARTAHSAKDTQGQRR